MLHSSSRAEHGLHEVERVGVEVLGEPGVGHDLRLVHGQLLGQDLLHPVSISARSVMRVPPVFPFGSAQAKGRNAHPTRFTR